MVCPKCGSERVKVELRSAGTTSKSNRYKTGVKSSWVIPSGQTSRKSKRNYKSIGVCQNCGHMWEIKKPTSFSDYVISIFVIIVIISVACRACNSRSANNSNNSEMPSESTSVWAAEDTPLSEFDYYIDDDGIHIKKCNSHSKTIYVASVYLYEDKALPVVSIEGSMAFRSVNSIIISEGITEIAHAAFNSCGVKYIYLPSTLTNFSGFSYFHDGEKLYYGGSKDEWDELYTGDRSKLDFVEIICGASISELLGT